MKDMRKSLFGRLVAVCVMSLFLMAADGSPVMAKTETGIQVRHKAIAFFVPEKRIRLEARVIKGDSEIKLVRCYFRATEQADYVFVEMESAEKGTYNAIIPAPSKDTTTLQYLFLVVDQNNQPIKTQVYTMNKKDSATVPSWQQLSSEGTIQVSTEIGEAQASVPGFSDSIVMNVVESSARFGVVAGGIYSMEGSAAAGTAASTTGAAGSGGTVSTATGTVSTGTVATTGSAGAGTGTAATLTGGAGSATAGTAATLIGTTAAAAGAGLSTAAIIGIGVGAAAVVGGGFALADSSGGDDSASNGGSTGNTPPISDVISTWEFRNKCANSGSESPVLLNIQLNETKGGSFSNNGIGQRDDYQGGITITTTLTGSFDAKTRVLSGIASTTANKLPFSCTRRDNFSTSVPSGINDTGYQDAVEQGSTGCGTETGCVLQVRFIRR